jgi:hypothetical protein
VRVPLAELTPAIIEEWYRIAFDPNEKTRDRPRAGEDIVFSDIGRPPQRGYAAHVNVEPPDLTGSELDIAAAKYAHALCAIYDGPVIDVTPRSSAARPGGMQRQIDDLDAKLKALGRGGISNVAYSMSLLTEERTSGGYTGDAVRS